MLQDSAIDVAPSDGDAVSDERSVLEAHKLWQKNVPHLYDVCAVRALDWPSLSVSWMPRTYAPATAPASEFDSSSSYLLLGTHTSDNEPNYLMVANVTLPTAGGAAIGGTPHNTINITQLIALDSEVNRARACPQLPSLVACQTGGADFLLFDVNKHPVRPLRGGVCIPEVRLHGHKKQGYGVSWSPLRTGMLVSGADDKMICVYDISATAIMQSAGGASAELRALSGAGEVGGGLEPLLQLSGHADVVEDVCCSPHSPHEFLSCSDDGTIRMWDPGTVFIQKLCIHLDVLQDARVPATRAGSAGAASDNAVMCVLNAHEAEVNAVAYSPFYDSLFVSVSADRTAALWDRRVMGGSVSGTSTKAATPVAVLEGGHSEQVFCVAWSPHHPTRLMTGAADRRVCMWDVSRLGNSSSNAASPPELIFVHGGHTEKLNDVAWHDEQENLCASVADNGAVHVWQPSADALL